MFCGGAKSAKGGLNPLADMDRGGPNPLADLHRRVQIRGGSKSAVTPAKKACTLIPPQKLQLRLLHNIIGHLRRF